jgi:hypothetical protein
VSTGLFITAPGAKLWMALVRRPGDPAGAWRFDLRPWLAPTLSRTARFSGLQTESNGQVIGQFRASVQHIGFDTEQEQLKGGWADGFRQ